MKQIFTCFLLLLSSAAFSQTLTGEVRDQIFKTAIGSVQVIHETKTVATLSNGQFAIGGVKIGDHLSFRLIGYETKEVVISKEDLNVPLIVYLTPKPMELQAVNIRAPRIHKKDSLQLRKEYAAIFNYKAPKFTDMFVKVNPEAKYPLALVRPPSTSSIISFNALQALKLFGKKKNSTTKLKTTLLAAEASSYIGNRFSISKVQTLTALQGDSLSNFMEQFKPTAQDLRQMNDYQLSIYIKSKYDEFVKPKR